MVAIVTTAGTITIIACWVAFAFDDHAFAFGVIYMLAFVAVIEAMGSVTVASHLPPCLVWALMCPSQLLLLPGSCMNLWC